MSTTEPRVPEIFNLTLTDADTEYSQALTLGTRQFSFQCRTAFAIRYAFVTGKVATPTAPYATVKSGNWYNSPEFLRFAAPNTIFFASSTAGVVVEITAWNPKE